MTTSNNSLLKKISIHRMEHLSEYDLFHNSLNTIIHSVFLINANRFEVTLKENYKLGKKDVDLFFYDYNKTDIYGHFFLNKCKQPAFQQKGNTVIFEPACLDLTKNYVIEILDERSNIFLDPSIGGILDSDFYAHSISDLGVKLKGNTAIFKVWSPPAGKIILKIFNSSQQPVLTTDELIMNRGDKGLWALEIVLSDLINVHSLDGLFYQYEVYAYGNKLIALDPYTKSMAAFNPSAEDKIGKGAVINSESVSAFPENFNRVYKNSHFIANEIDLIVYEVHVRDFTIQPDTVSIEFAGTFKGFVEKIGYLKKLGITHVQLLPVQNFYSVDETDRSFKDSDSPDSNYNWGYDPHNYFTPEGVFSTDSSEPYTRIRELRELVQALHNQGIGVIMDVVYNHTYITEIFENIAPGCYYRYDNDIRISGTTGAGPSLESRRKMVRKLILDSLKYFVECYHIDGFRFDLMGFLDHETMEAIRNEVGAVYNKENIYDLILHGEAWVFSDLDTDPNTKGQNAATTKINYPEKKLNLGIFNDNTRDSYTGRELNQGFIHGNYLEADRVAAGITGGLKGFDTGKININTDRFKDLYNSFSYSPENCLNYLTIHDGYTLWDKINLSCKDKTKLMRAQMMRMANAMLFTSQGKIIIHGGDELFRTKPLAKIDKEKNRAHTSDFVNEEEGIKYFHENSYCSNDFTNMIRWDRITNDYLGISTTMLEYYRGLIEMRRCIPAFRFKKTESIKKGLVFYEINEIIKSRPIPCITFSLDNTLEKDFGKNINGTEYFKLIVVFNADDKSVSLNISAIDNPAQWMVILDDHNAGIKPLFFAHEITQERGKTNVLIEKGKLTVPAKSVAVIAK